MKGILEVIQERQSVRIPFDPERSVAKDDLRQILEAARWAPTAHNMQNFEVLVVDDKELLEKIGNIKSRISAEFLRENYQQLSFSEEELLKKKAGLLGTIFPPSWRDPAKLEEVAREGAPFLLKDTVRNSPLLLIVVYDPRKRAPASEGDVLGFMSLGCVMLNMWLMAHSLGIGFHVMSVFSGAPAQKELKSLLHIPDDLKIAFASRLGYPISTPSKYLRVRRDVEDFTHHNRFGSKNPD
jgi:nitroreductase